MHTRDWTTADVNRMTGGCLTARSAVYAAVFQRLRGMAAGLQSGESARHQYSPTELVQETFLRRLHNLRMRLENRMHFLQVARRLLVQTQVDLSRQRRAQRRNGGMEPLPLETTGRSEQPLEEPAILLRIALSKLELVSPMGARLLRLKYYDGMSLEEMAAAAGLTEWQVRVQLKAAENWLAEYLPQLSKG